MNVENLIAIIGIIVSAIVAYFTAKFTIGLERKKGKLIIIELVIKYIANFNSCWDLQTGKLKTDEISKLQYLRVMESIESGLNQLTSNPYYLDLIYEYPKLTMLKVYITREIAQTINSNDFALNEGTLKNVFTLYEMLKPDFKKKDFRKGGRFFYIENLVVDWKKSWGIT